MIHLIWAKPETTLFLSGFPPPLPPANIPSPEVRESVYGWSRNDRRPETGQQFIILPHSDFSHLLNILLPVAWHKMHSTHKKVPHLDAYSLSSLMPLQTSTIHLILQKIYHSLPSKQVKVSQVKWYPPKPREQVSTEHLHSYLRRWPEKVRLKNLQSTGRMQLPHNRSERGE